MGSVSEPEMQWPVKKREVITNLFDSTRWNFVTFRPDDIIIGTWSKSGTSWMQQIVRQLMCQGAEDGPALSSISPWVDFRMVPGDVILATVEEQQHRRCMKTHLPIDALVYDQKAKYITVWRDGRDMIFSGHNHFSNTTDEWLKSVNSGTFDGLKFERPAKDPRQHFLELLVDDRHPSSVQPMWEYMRGWWAARDLPNHLMIHFNDLKVDMRGEIQRIAEFLEIDVQDEAWPAILEHCSFDYMKSHAAELVPRVGGYLEGGATQFIHKGTNGRWRDVLTKEDVEKYEQKVLEEVGEDCAKWLANGRKGAASLS